MEQRRLTLGAQHEADIAQPRQVGMDHRMPPTDRGDQHVTDGLLGVGGEGLGRVPERRQVSGGHPVEDGRLDEHPDPRVRRQQGRHVLRVEVVRMLVGDQHRIQVGQPRASRR